MAAANVAASTGDGWLGLAADAVKGNTQVPACNATNQTRQDLQWELMIKRDTG